MMIFLTVPSPPEDVTLYPLSEGQVKLKWNPPTKKNGVIIFYIIQYHPHQDDPEFLWSSIHSNGQYDNYWLIEWMIDWYILFLDPQYLSDDDGPHL